MHIADDHTRWDDDLPAYALGALDERATAAFAEHLAGCDRCRAQLDRLAPAVDLLPGAVEQLEPPPAVRRRIMDVVASDLAQEGAAAPARAAAPRPRRGWRPLVALAGAAAVAAAFAIGVLVARDEHGPGTTTVPVQALAPAGAGQVRGALVRDGDDWQLDVRRLPQLRGDRVYQAWVMRGRSVEPSTVFVLARDRTASVAIPQRLHDGDRVLVTAEPRGGSRMPTTRPLLSAQV